MARYTGSVANLIGGVSQQPPEIRPANTASGLRNSVSSVIAGLGKRPASSYVGIIPGFSGTDSVAQTPFEGQDGQDRLVSIVDGAIQVINLVTGANEPVTYNGVAQSYIQGLTDSNRDLGMLKVQDYIFVYNKTTTVQTEDIAEDGSRYDPKLFGTVWSKQANANSNYSVYINNVLEANVATGTGDTSYDATAIANSLHTQLEAKGYVVYQNGSVLDIELQVNDTISTNDGLGGTGLPSWKDSIGQFTDLPPDSFPGRMVRVRGDVEAGGDDYYVEWDGDSWVETVAFGKKRRLAASTMPHTLIYNSDGTWTFEEHEWNPRVAGDDDSNADPNFVGETINYLFRLKGRLGILSSENVTMSVSNAFENLYRYSCTQLFDDDRIDIAADGSTQRGGLNYVTYNQQDVIIFSDDAQYKLFYSDGILGPNTVDLKQTTSYSCSPRVEPVDIGPNLLFLDGFGGSQYDSFQEYAVNQDSRISAAQEVTASVPEYIPAGTYHMTHSSSEKAIVVLSEGDRSTLWYYQYFYNSEGKQQSAWQPWDLRSADVYGAIFIEDKLYLTIWETAASGQDHLRVVVFDPTLYLGSQFSLNRVLLDQKLDQTGIVSVTYNAAQDRTEVVGRIQTGSQTLTAVTEKGRVYDADQMVGSTAYFNGVDFSTQSFVVGIRYDWEWELSPLYFRDQNQVAIQDGRFQLQYVSFLTNSTSYFQYDVTPDARDKTTYTYVARGFSRGINQFGPTAIANEEVKIAAFGEGPKTNIKLYSDSPYPVRVSSLEWTGTWRPRTKRR